MSKTLKKGEKTQIHFPVLLSVRCRGAENIFYNVMAYATFYIHSKYRLLQSHFKNFNTVNDVTF
jgi:hypothetical protein